VEADYGGLCLTELGPAYYRRPIDPLCNGPQRRPPGRPGEDNKRLSHPWPCLHRLLRPAGLKNIDATERTKPQWLA
jgi:hypothetical protein